MSESLESASESSLPVSASVSTDTDKSNSETRSPDDIKTILNMFSGAFRRLDTTHMNRNFNGDFPFYMAPWRSGIGRRMLQSVTHKDSEQKIMPVKLDPIIGLKQKTGADCVVASFLSAFSTITGTPIMDELYDGFIQVSDKHKIVDQEKNKDDNSITVKPIDGISIKDESGVRVLPYVFNVFETSQFREKFPAIDVKVAQRTGINLDDLSNIVRTAKKQKNPSYDMYVFLHVPSWIDSKGEHMVTLHEITPTATTVFDPRLGEERLLSNSEFDERWGKFNRRAIFVFAEKVS